MKTIITLFILALISINSNAAEKIANCLIESNGRTEFKGKCKFNAEENGSFYISSTVKGKALVGDEIFGVNVYIVEKDTAEVSGSMKGSNSRWGEAKRSPTDKSCWLGEDFKICVK